MGMICRFRRMHFVEAGTRIRVAREMRVGHLVMDVPVRHCARRQDESSRKSEDR